MLGLVSRALEIYDREGLLSLLSRSSRYVRERWMWYEKQFVKRYIWLTSETHTEAYRRWMDYRIGRLGAKAAVGGFGTGRGTFQYELLRSEGLRPEDRLLDVGCGSLRGGRYFVDYLRAGNYTGMDISRSIIEEGKSIVGEGTLREKTPTFVVNEDLRFEEFDGTFDYIVAQGVFAHLPEREVRECLWNVGSVMHDGSAFYVTYFDAADREKFDDDPSAYAYTRDELSAMASDAGRSIRFLDPDEYPYPGTMRTAIVTRG